jgi:phage-related protein
MAARPATKPVEFIGSSKIDLSAMPVAVRMTMGQALYEAQCGGMSRFAKPLKGFGGASVVEVVEDFDGDAFRAIYTVRFAGVIYVLHAFQKKATKGVKTPMIEMEKVRARLKIAEELFAARRATDARKRRE